MISQMQSCFRLTVCIVVGLLFVGAPANAQSDGKLKIGFVYFLSGPGASFGIHARNGSQLIVDALNSGSIPAPYNAKGIGGFEIVPIYVDEAGGAQKQLAEYRRIVERAIGRCDQALVGVHLGAKAGRRGGSTVGRGRSDMARC